MCFSLSHFSVQETSSTEPSETASVSRDGIIALGVVFGTFAVAMGAFVAYLIYREKKGKPSFGPQVRIQWSLSPTLAKRYINLVPNNHAVADFKS